MKHNEKDWDEICIMTFIHKWVYVNRFSPSGCTESSFSNLRWLYLGVELNPLLSQHPSREMRSECEERWSDYGSSGSALFSLWCSPVKLWISSGEHLGICSEVWSKSLGNNRMVSAFTWDASESSKAQINVVMFSDSRSAGRRRDLVA